MGETIDLEVAADRLEMGVAAVPPGEAWHFCPYWDRQIRGACYECPYCNDDGMGDPPEPN